MDLKKKCKNYLKNSIDYTGVHVSVKKFGQSCARVPDVKKGGENITNGDTTNGSTKEHVNGNGYVNGNVNGNGNGPNLGIIRFF